MRISQFPQRISLNDANVLKAFVCKWTFFIPFIGHIFLLIQYTGMMGKISVLSRRFMRSKRYFGLASPIILIWLSIVIDWVFFWLLLGTTLYLVIGGEPVVMAQLYLLVIIGIGLVVFIVFLFVPILFRTQVEYGIAAIEMTLDKVAVLPDLIVGAEQTSIQ
ncbi:MAG: hypothetical protein LBS76_03915 [Mycoplasmataceae bacterium]|nr:hypothetical protein [Mycoplasmataceae bacterium]